MHNSLLIFDIGCSSRLNGCNHQCKDSKSCRLVLGVRMRSAADPDFTFKLAVECGVDAMIIVTVNLLARRERFFTELEFVLSQVQQQYQNSQNPLLC